MKRGNSGIMDNSQDYTRLDSVLRHLASSASLRTCPVDRLADQEGDYPLLSLPLSPGSAHRAVLTINGGDRREQASQAEKTSLQYVCLLYGRAP